MNSTVVMVQVLSAIHLTVEASEKI